MKQYTILFISMLLLMSCHRQPQAGERPILTVTLEPLRYFTEAIAGEHFKVVSMVPDGSSPETYDPTPQQMVALSQSTAYLRIGYIGFEQNWIDKLQGNSPELPFFDMSAGIDLIREESKMHGDHIHEGGIEPHIWNSCRNARLIAQNICQTLCQLDSIHTDYYQNRLDSLNLIIDNTEHEVRNYLTQADSTFLIYHPALSYFARDYGLTQISIEEGGKEPSPAHLKALIEQSGHKKARIIFVQQEFDTRNAELIAKEAQLKIVPINPLSYHWDEEMKNVARALQQP